MKSYAKTQIEQFLNSDLTTYWWNMGSKKKDFDGTVKEYFEMHLVKLSFRADKTNEFGRIKITARFSIGQLQNISFHSYDIEQVVKMVVSTRLMYLGDKSKFELSGRTRTINFLLN